MSGATRSWLIRALGTLTRLPLPSELTIISIFNVFLNIPNHVIEHSIISNNGSWLKLFAQAIHPRTGTHSK
jgi:hypothetical protein